MKKNLLLILMLAFTIGTFAQTDIVPHKSGSINQGAYDGNNFLSSLSLRNSTSWMRYGLMFFDLSSINSSEIQSASIKVYLNKIEHHNGSAWVDYDLADVGGNATFELSVLDYTPPLTGDTSYNNLIVNQSLSMTKVAELIDVPYSALNSTLTFTGTELTNIVKAYATTTNDLCLVLSTITGNDTNPTKIRCFFNTINDATDKPTLTLDVATGLDPAMDNSIITFNSESKSIKVSNNYSTLNIFSITGKLVKSVKNGDTTISVNDLDKGIYIVNAIIDGKAVNTKISIQ